ncbi:MAG: hypothetical protein ACYC6L_17540 [Anaerolineae bacterium]
MQDSNITWWKILLTIIGPAILFVPLATTLAGFLVVFNFGWGAAGISQSIGNLYSLGILTLFFFVLFLANRRSSSARVWLTLPFFTLTMLVILTISTFGFNTLLAARLVAIAALVGMYAFASWVIWKILLEV